LAQQVFTIHRFLTMDDGMEAIVCPALPVPSENLIRQDSH